jgi:hypothetical protein
LNQRGSRADEKKPLPARGRQGFVSHERAYSL